MALLLIVLRRLLLVPSALFAGILGLAAFSSTGDFFFGLCPPERLEYLGSELDYIGGDHACVAPWYPLAEAFTIFVGATTASSLFVLLPALIEPVEHYWAAVISYIIGATLMIFMLSIFSATPTLTAVISLAVGLGCVWLVRKRFGEGGKVASLAPK